MPWRILSPATQSTTSLNEPVFGDASAMSVLHPSALKPAVRQLGQRGNPATASDVPATGQPTSVTGRTMTHSILFFGLSHAARDIPFVVLPTVVPRSQYSPSSGHGSPERANEE